MTRVSYQKGSLRHDDRLDALSMAVAYWVEQMSADQQATEDDIKSEWMKQQLTSYMDNAFSTTREKGSHKPNWIN